MARKGSDEALMAAAAEGWSHARAARAAGISVATVKRRLAEPHIVAAIRDFRLQQRRAHVAQLGAVNGDAIARLHGLIHHDDPHVALRAVALVLSTSPKMTAVVELEERLHALECAEASGAHDADEEAQADE